MKKPGFKIGRAVMYLVLIIVALIQLFPLYWLMAFSLKNNAEILGANPIGLPQNWVWDNYLQVFLRDSQQGNIATYFLNSVIVTSVSIVISTVFGSMAAYAIGRMTWKLSSKTLTLFLSGLMIPIHATLVPLLFIFTRTRLTDTIWALILPYSAFALPMAVYVLVGFFKALPRELEEAACLDGTNIYGTFTHIMLPLIRPAIATVSIFTYLSCWNELMFAITFIQSPVYQTLTAGVKNMTGGVYSRNFGMLGAGLAIATVPTLLIYLLLSNQIQKSFTTGALKG
jgi:raffinose/stachyose/melibiose transport system permease protein